MDDPKISLKNFLAKMILNGPIRKVIIVKLKYEDLRIFFTTGSTKLDTSKIFHKNHKFKFVKFRQVEQV